MTLDLKRLAELVRLAADKVEEINKGGLVPAHEEALWDSVASLVDKVTQDVLEKKP